MVERYMSVWDYRKQKRSLGKLVGAGLITREEYFKKLDLLKLAWRYSPLYDGEE